VRRLCPPWYLSLPGMLVRGERYGGAVRAPRDILKLLIVAEDENANPAGFTLAPFFVRCELQAGFRTIAKVL
jgi:hypothetical protein